MPGFFPSCRTPRIRTLQNETWGNGQSRAEDWFISSVLFFAGVIITSLWRMHTSYCREKWQSEQFDAVKQTHIMCYKAKQKHIFIAFKLSTSSFFAPVSPVFMYVERAGERHVDVLVIQANQGREERAIAAELTPWGPQLSKVSDLHLWEIAPENKTGGRAWGGEKVDIDQMHVQTNSCQAQHTKNNVAWATLAPRVWCLPSEFFRVRQNIWWNCRHIMIIIIDNCFRVHTGGVAAHLQRDHSQITPVALIDF